MDAPGLSGALFAMPVNASAGVGNKGASRQAFIGYTSATMTSGSSQDHAGRLTAPDKSSDSGKPAATATRRQKLPASTLSRAPNTVAALKATQRGTPAFCKNPKTIQLPTQAIRAGKGQRSNEIGIFGTRGLYSRDANDCKNDYTRPRLRLTLPFQGEPMKVKQILSGVELVIADLEVQLEGELRSSHTLCALLRDEGGKEVLIPLNTPDGRPIFMNPDNAIADGADHSH
jgi:hypothetical protein